MRCPKCGFKLKKEDVVVVRDFALDAKAGRFRETKREALCSVCGHVLGVKKLEG